MYYAEQLGLAIMVNDTGRCDTVPVQVEYIDFVSDYLEHESEGWEDWRCLSLIYPEPCARTYQIEVAP